MTLRTATILAALALFGCDKPLPPDPVEPAPVVATLNTDPTPVSIEGTIAGTPGPALHWEHAINAANIAEIAICEGRLYALSQGRIVEWDAQALVPKRVLTDFAGVSSIDAHKDILFAGTSDGRLLRSFCDGGAPELSPDADLEVLAVRADVRSRTRGLVAYREPPTAENELDGVHVVVAHVDFDTGHGLREAFARPMREDDSVSLFVDYRGANYFSLGAPGKRGTAWFLDRFDDAQPPIENLPTNVDLRGLAQLSRQVWVFGGATDGGSARIFRVDTQRARPMWDGKEAWFGEQPGGDLPKAPISALIQRKGDVLLVAGDGAYRVDMELRRWTKLLNSDPKPEALATTTRLLALGDNHVVGTPDGIVMFGDREWRRSTVAQHAATPPQLTRVTTTAQWGGETWSASDNGVLANKTRVAAGPSAKVRALFGGESALWVFADDGLWRMTGKTAKDVARWNTTADGFHARLVRDAAERDGDLWLNLQNGATIRARID